ncbi:hypothetical protein yc1106_02459 [Curvularia clavata]|uniref:Uncharacterized protein n=1 Tax=Curvularia clavata TaxID=95742 RepID=A0A9Q8Z4U3_CURCL|nr:hypothetical protein yc1106_02459 [Curvularia clavata]
MKFGVLPVLLLAALVHANPAPASNSKAIRGPNAVDDVAECHDLFTTPDPHVIARALKKKKKKKGSGSSANLTDSAAVGFVTPSRALQASALGVGVIEIVRLWG